jgi:hypothetical protein
MPMIAPKTSTQEGKAMRSLLVVVFFVCLTIAGCGGGGGSDDGGGAPSAPVTPVTNSAPVANAGPDQNVTTGSTVTLNGSGSSDADGDLLTYAWGFVSVPQGSNAELADVAAATPKFTADVDGDYVVQLIVNDGTVSSPADTVTIVAATADYSSLFLLTNTSTVIYHSAGFYLANSLFRLRITNTSDIPFVCTRAELRYGDAVVNFTEDPATLRAYPGDDQIIDPTEFVDVIIPLPVNVPDNDVFEFRYYLTRPDTNEEGMVFHKYINI